MILLSPVMLLFYQENGLTVKELFFFQGIFYLTQIIFELPIGYLADIFSKKYMLITSFVAFLTGTLIWYNFTGYKIILIGEILYAISKVSMDVTTSGYLFDYLKSENSQNIMPKFLGYMNFYLAAGTAVAGVIGAFLYSKYGSSKVLLLEIFLTLFGIFLLVLLKNIPSTKEKQTTFIEKCEDFKLSIKAICKDNNINGYILYSGLLTSISILFALSFQPLMQLAAFPIFLFGIISSTNHGIRAVFSAISGKIPFNVHKTKIPLFILYLLSFCAIFILNFSKNIPLNFALILFICLVIGIQLMFTIRHIARLHKLTNSNSRGSLMSVNNIVPKILTVIILISVHFLMNNAEMWKFFLYYFIFFACFGSFLLYKTRKITE